MLNVIAYRRPVTYETDKMIGFINFDTQGSVSVNEYSTAKVYTGYSYVDAGADENTWLMFNHSTVDLSNNSAKNYDVAPIYYIYTGKQYQYASSNGAKGTTGSTGLRCCMTMPVQKGGQVTWDTYQIKSPATYKPTYSYHYFKELQNKGKIGFIGKQLSSGTLKQIAYNSKVKNNWIVVSEDCWLYTDICHYALMFNNSNKAPNRDATDANKFNGWVVPFVRRVDDVEYYKNTAANSEYVIRLKNDGTNEYANNKFGMLIPLKKGQCFGLAASKNSTVVNLNYTLYSMDYSWNSFVTYINFNDVLYAPQKRVVRLKNSTTFKYTASKNCWVYIGAQTGDTWTIDNSIVLKNSTGTNGAYIRHCRFVPLRYGQTITLTYSKVSSNKIIDWGNNVKFAVYGMQPLIES